MSSFFTPASQKKPEAITWRVLGTSVVIGKYVPEKKAQVLPEKDRKIAAFDLVRFVYFTAGSFAVKCCGADPPPRIRPLSRRGLGMCFPSLRMIGNGGAEQFQRCYRSLAPMGALYIFQNKKPEVLLTLPDFKW